MMKDNKLKLTDIRNIAEISGFGGGYEKACQDMLQAGWEWMCQNREKGLAGNTYKNVYGIFKPGNQATEELSKTIVAASGGDCSGAMHQAVMGHLMYINTNGLDKWMEEVRK